jgi:hypothetical protein
MNKSPKYNYKVSKGKESKQNTHKQNLKNNAIYILIRIKFLFIANLTAQSPITTLARLKKINITQTKLIKGMLFNNNNNFINTSKLLLTSEESKI